jgi:glycosyltransferase involved in cell wall biosynthesis
MTADARITFRHLAKIVKDALGFRGKLEVRQKTLKMWLKPTNDLKLVDKKDHSWSVTGEDPQFHLMPNPLDWSGISFAKIDGDQGFLRQSAQRFRGNRMGNTFCFSPGLYSIAPAGGRHLERLRGASLYIDTGAGFSESDRLPIDFAPSAGWNSMPEGVFAVVRFDRPVRAIRFDPSTGDARPQFALKGLEFTLLQSPLTPSSNLENGIADTRPKVLLNLVRLLPGNEGAGGAGRLCLALLRYLPEHVRLRAAIPPDHAHLARIFPLVEFVILPADDNAHLGPHLSWCTVYIDPLNGLRPTAIEANVVVIALVLDLQHLRMPWFFTRAEFDSRVAEYGYAIERSDRLIAISDYERQNLEVFYGATEVSVVHLSGFMAEEKHLTQEEIEGRRKSGGQRNYLIYPAVPWLHKNHEILIQAISCLRRRGVDVPLVLTNTQGKTELGARLTKLSASLGVADLVTCEPFMPEEALLDRYLHATGMVFPSLYEGFGIPLVDAMMLGVPLLVNNTSAVPEICGEACATFTNARNALAVAEDIERFWRDADQRARLVKSGFEQAKKFSSQKMAADIGAVITEAIEKKSKGGAISSCALRAPQQFSPLSVFVAYVGLSEAEIGTLRSIEDIDSFHASLFGSDACVTVGLDIRLAENEAIWKLFKGTARLICFDGAERGALDFGVQEFSARYDESAFQLVTKYPHCVSTYRPETIRATILALTLYANADYAVPAQDVEDCVVDPLPSDVAGALAYDSRRKYGHTVWDALIRRGAVPNIQNGTVSFLSYFATRCRQMRVPNKGRL